MKKPFLSLLFSISLFSLGAQNFVSTYAGTGAAALTNGDTASCAFNQPFGLARDAAGNLYIADANNNCIRKIDANGTVTTFAGNGTAGYMDGPAASAEFSAPSDLFVDAQGNIFVSDFHNHRIRKISGGVVTTIAGNGIAGYVDGADSLAEFDYPRGIVEDANGNIYVGDSWNHRIRKIDVNGNVSTYAGGGAITGLNSVGALADGADTAARFYTLSGLAIDAAGNIYVADAYNHRIRKVDPSRNVTTIAGSGATGPGNGGYANGPANAAVLNTPTELYVDNQGTIYFSDTFSDRVRKISNGYVSTLGGNGSAGYMNGVDSLAMFNYPRGIVLNTAGNAIFLCDYNNNRIRKITLAATGMEEIPGMQISLFPNPVASTFTVTFTGNASAEIFIYDLSGKCVFEKQDAKPGEAIDLSGFSAGVYSVMILQENKRGVSKLVKL